MEYILLKTGTENALFRANEDGSIKVSGVYVKVGIVGAPEGKFIQADIIPDFDIPADKTSAEQPAYIDSVAQLYVTVTYPNT